MNPHLPEDELREKLKQIIRAGYECNDAVQLEFEKDPDKFVDEILALVTAETQKAISRVLDDTNKEVIGEDDEITDDMSNVLVYRLTGKNYLKAEQRATLKKLREEWL